jgi:hypothetical protein
VRIPHKQPTTNDYNRTPQRPIRVHCVGENLDREAAKAAAETIAKPEPLTRATAPRQTHPVALTSVRDTEDDRTRTACSIGTHEASSESRLRRTRSAKVCGSSRKPM